MAGGLTVIATQPHCLPLHAHARAASCMHAGACACLHSALHPAGRTACRCISASRVPVGHSAELIAARQWRAACFSAPQAACHCRWQAGGFAAQERPPEHIDSFTPLRRRVRPKSVRLAAMMQAPHCCKLPPQLLHAGLRASEARRKRDALNCTGAKAGKRQAESEPGAMAVERFAASGARAAGAAAEGAVEEPG